jgi:RNA polymerase sigma-70 factor (ECF subfamily)
VQLRERIVGYGTLQVGRDSAEDLAQETLMLLERRYPHLDQLGDLIPLSIRIMSLKIKGLRRTAGRRKIVDTPVDEMPVQDETPDAGEQLAMNERRKSFFDALNKLGERCRRLLLLKLDGHRLTEIREMMGADNMQLLYTWDFRCRKEMQKLIVSRGPR